MNTVLFSLIIIGAVFLAYKFLGLIIGSVISLLILAFIVYYNYASILLGRANAEFNKGNTKKALELYKKAYNRKNRKFTVDISYANALLRIGEPEVALKIIDKVLSNKVSRDIKLIAVQTRCMVKYKLGMIDEAYEDARELFDDGIRTSNMYCLVGFFMILKNMPIDETFAFCKKAYDYDSDNRDIVDNMLVCYIKKNMKEEAVELAEKMTERFPLFVEAWYHGAQAQRLGGNIQKAREYLNKIDDAKRSYLTTVSVEEVSNLKKELGI